MGCPPVRGDNPRALASGLSYVQVDNVQLFYTTYMSVVDLAHHEILRAKVGKGDINICITTEILSNILILIWRKLDGTSTNPMFLLLLTELTIKLLRDITDGLMAFTNYFLGICNRLFVISCYL